MKDPECSDALGIDVGSTYIKTARLTDGAVQAGTTARHPTPNFMSIDLPGARWLRADELLSQVDMAIEHDSNRHGEPSLILVTGQMHGCLFSSINQVRPLSPISTWQDRTARDFQVGRRWHEVRQMVDEELLSRNGNELDFGYPLVVLPLLREHADLKNSHDLRYVSLLSLVVEHLTGTPSDIHVTDAAASGMYDIRASGWIPSALEIARVADVSMPNVRDQASGERVWLAVGDHQASLLGGDFDQDSVAINVGTGAQVSVLLNPGQVVAVHSAEGPAVHTRPFFEGTFFQTITDLPAGRELRQHETDVASAADAYRQAALAIGDAHRNRIQLTGSIFSSMPEFTEQIERAFGARATVTEDEPALTGLAKLAARY